MLFSRVADRKTRRNPEFASIIPRKLEEAATTGGETFQKL